MTLPAANATDANRVGEMTNEKPMKQSRGLRTALWLSFAVLGWSAIVAVVFAVNALAVYPVLPAGRTITLASWDDGYATVEGTWELEGQRLAAAANFTYIFCRAQTMTCTESASEIVDGILQVTVRVRPVVSWTRDTITTRDDTACYSYMMTINRQTESVTALQVRPDNLATCLPSAPGVETLPKRQEYRLIDGMQAGIEARTRISNSVVVPIFWVAIGLWSLFVGSRIWRIWRREPRQVQQ